MRQHVLSAVIALLIVGFLGASFMMIAPVKEADAWLLHLCCEYTVEIVIGSDGYEIVVIIEDCDSVFHGHIWPCGYVCPSS